jgi:hypothetical protein
MTATGRNKRRVNLRRNVGGWSIRIGGIAAAKAASVLSATRLHAAGTNPITAMQGQTTDEATDQDA